MTLNWRNFSIPVLFLLATFVLACDSQRIFEEHVALKNATWKSMDKVQFDVAIPDLLTRYNVYLNVRNGVEYPYANLYLFMNTVFPDGKIARDTIELTLADYDGRWLGSGMGNVKFSRFMFKKGVQFEKTGKYRFELEQAMRVNDLKGIHDIGLRIEKQ
jgi:gliding motility-associated lipoprotein GldH